MLAQKTDWRAARSRLLGAFARVASWPAPFRWAAEALDANDEVRARVRRGNEGRRGSILSWERAADGLWTARLSGPEVPRTVERRGWTRVQAIERAVAAGQRIKDFRADRAACCETPHRDGRHRLA